MGKKVDLLPTESKAAPVAAGGLKTSHIILILGALAIVTTGVVVAMVLINKSQSAVEPLPVASNYEGIPIINEDNVAQIKQQIKEKAEKGMFQTYMNTTWVFPDGKSPSSNAVMGNSEANRYPFWFELTLNNTDEVVYRSSLLPVGSLMKEIVLDEDLEPGDYMATLNIHLVDENNDAVESNMGFMISLKVMN